MKPNISETGLPTPQPSEVLVMNLLKAVPNDARPPVVEFIGPDSVKKLNEVNHLLGIDLSRPDRVDKLLDSGIQRSRVYRVPGRPVVVEIRDQETEGALSTSVHIVKASETHLKLLFPDQK